MCEKRISERACDLQDCPELCATTLTVQNGYKETYDDLGISERKELHLSLRPRAWPADTLDEMRQVGFPLGYLRGRGIMLCSPGLPTTFSDDDDDDDDGF